MERRIALIASFALVAGACGSKDGDDTEPSGDDSTAPDTDVDDDGVTSAVDCDDEAADVGGPTTWYADADGDGYGDASSTAEACDANEDQVDNPDDCDDDDDDVHPNATERCNNHDDDCDEMVDDDDPDADLDTFYRDEDDDGYGTTGDTEHACEAPDGYSSKSTDCNDADETIRPGVADPCDGVDQDCDGPEDACRTTGSIYARDLPDSLSGSLAGDGSAVAMANDADGDGFDDLLVSAPAGNGRVLRVSGITRGSDQLADFTTAVLEGTKGSTLGRELAVVPDVDADGYDDLATTLGDVTIAVVSGPLVGTSSASDALVTWSGDDSVEAFGDIVGGALFGSGTSGVVVPLWSDDEGTRIALMDPTVPGDSFDDARTWIRSSATVDVGAYAAAATGDANGDGITDLLIGAAGDYGSARFFYGPFDADLDVSDADTEFEPDSFSASSHWSSFGGDLVLTDANGDGLADAIIGDSYYGVCVACLNGSISLFEAPFASGMAPGDDDDAQYIGGTADSKLVDFVVGDLDGDGASDIAIQRQGPSDIVAIYGPMTGTADVDASAGQLQIYGFYAYGDNPMLFHDLDRDGSDELVIGDPTYYALPDGGVAFVWGTLPY